MKRLLVLDDQAGAREALRAVFTPGYDVRTAAHGDEALEWLRSEPFDLFFCDIMMPGRDGLDVLRETRVIDPGLPVIMVTASSSVAHAVEAMKQGAFDYISKPFDVEAIRALARRALTSGRPLPPSSSADEKPGQDGERGGTLGQDAGFLRVLEHARQAAESEGPVLLRGEPGTGKEQLARHLHSLSPRRNEPFVAVICAGRPEPILEEDLFGVERAPRTPDEEAVPGQIDRVGQGTLFLDEVGEMTPTLQAKILRMVDTGEVVRVGGIRVHRCRARVVVATRRDLARDVREGRFREDLYYHLGVASIHLPPLRERRQDIPLLVNHFLAACKENMETELTSFSTATLDLLMEYPWPGNVRELKTLVETMALLHHDQPTLVPAHLPEELHRLDQAPSPTAPHENLEEAVNAYERQLVRDALQRAGWVQTRAAKMLGTTRRILRYRMEKLGIVTPR